MEKVQQVVADGDSSKALGSYVDFIVKLSLGLLSIGAVIALIVVGITYIGSETWSKKSNAKDLIMRSIGSLVLMFSAFIFFNQLNPELLKVRFEPLIDKEKIIDKDLEYRDYFDDGKNWGKEGWEPVCSG